MGRGGPRGARQPASEAGAEVAAVTTLLQRKMSFPGKSLHHRHADCPFQLPREGRRWARRDSASKSQTHQDQLGILRSLSFPSGVTAALHSAHVALWPHRHLLVHVIGGSLCSRPRVGNGLCVVCSRQSTFHGGVPGLSNVLFPVSSGVESCPKESGAWLPGKAG